MLFLQKNVCCDFLSELSHQGSSDEESQHILKETSNEKSELVLLEWTPRLCLVFVLYNTRLVTTFIIAMYGVRSIHSLCHMCLYFMQNWMKYKKKTEFYFALEVSFSRF